MTGASKDPHIEPAVFYPAALLVVAFVLFAAVFTETARGVFDAVLAFITDAFGWFYVLATTFFLVFALWLIVSPYRKVRLGTEDDVPEFSNFAWFSMLFGAGMGIGLVFWGVAEPITHLAAPPLAEPGTPAAAQESLRFTFFHWGLHPWAIYTLFGLGLAHFHFRHGLPLAPRSLFHTLLGDRIHGPIGHTIDVLAVIGTLFGVATSLGLGAIQVNTGLQALTGLGVETSAQIVIIAVITLIATASVVLGLKRGIRVLSNFNVTLAIAFLLFVLLVGPTLFLLELFVGTLGSYLQFLPFMSLWTGGVEDTGWQAAWTLFYWGWWISWAPFVGTFIARISKGRTVQEFVVGVLLVPTVASFVWFSVFGGTALFMDLMQGTDLTEAALSNPPLALYAMLDRLPLTALASAIATLLVVVFFVTSSDSASFVVDMVTSGGNPNPPVLTRVFWAIAEGAIAAVLLLAGGLVALQTAAISAGLPIAFLLLAVTYGLVRDLHAVHHTTTGHDPGERTGHGLRGAGGRD